MNSVHLTAVIMTLLLYVIIGVAYFGWGKAVLLALGRDRIVMEGIPVSFSIWVGWACTLLLFQLIHLVLALTVYVVSPIFVFGIALSAIFLIRSRRQSTAISLPLSQAKKATIVVIIVLVSEWISSRSMLPPTNYDSGLYHFNAIRWINSFPIVPGLGNLHGRLAFNQSFFTYVAALNLHPFFDHGRSLANSILLLLTLLTQVEVTLPLIRRPALATHSHPLQWASGVFCFPILAYWALSSNGLASPSPDLTSGLLQLVIFVVFGLAVVDFARDGRVSLCDSIVLFILAATAVTVKLSNLAFCGVVMALVLIGSLKTSDKRIGDSVRLLLPAVLIVLVLCVHGVALSGAPLYPSTIGYIHAEWSVPVDRVIDEANWVYSWARQPGTHWTNVLGNWNWLAPWFQRVATRLTAIVYPLGVFLALSMINVVASVFWKSRSKKRLFVHEIVLLPLFAGLVFWFVTAPDPRFANALFLLLPVSAILLLAAHVQKRVNSTVFTVIICVFFIVGNLNLLGWAYWHKWTLKHISLDGYQVVKRVPLNEEITRTGLRVYTPVSGDQCWDAPIPCTPNFNENLRLREPYDMSSGFTVSGAGDNKNDAEQGAALDEDSAALHRRQ